MEEFRRDSTWSGSRREAPWHNVGGPPQVLTDWPAAAGAGRMHDERVSVTHPDFNEAAWIERLAAALEQVAEEAEPSYSPPPPLIPGPRPSASIGQPSTVDTAPSRNGQNTIRQPRSTSRNRACGSRRIPPKR